MTIEELKALAYADDGGYRSGVAEDLFLTIAPETLALVEAALEDVTDETGDLCDCQRPLCAAARAWQAKLASL